MSAIETPPPTDDAPHVLLVDDDRRIRQLLSRVLQREGYRVTVADSAEDARARIRGLSFDLIILDVMMPGENGFQFAERLRADAGEIAHAPILMLTARAEIEDRIRGLEAGVDDYLAKPYDVRELTLRVAALLRRSARTTSAAPRPTPRGSASSASTPTAANCAGATRSSASPSANAKCCAPCAKIPAKPSRARRWREARRPTSARWTCRSIVCGARSRKTPPIPCFCRPCAAWATAWRRNDDPFRATAAALEPARPRPRERDAQGPLRAFAADRDRPHGDPAIGHRRGVHGAPLERGDLPPVQRREPGHRRADRHPQEFRLRRPRRRKTHANRARKIRLRGAGAAAGTAAPRPAPPVLLPARPRDVAGDRPADHPALLDRHRGPVGSHRGAHRPRRRHFTRGGASQPGLCLEHPHLHRVDGGHGGGADRGGHPVHAQPGPPDHGAGRRGRGISARAARSSSARAAPARCGAPPSPSWK